jgi:hypothetical protein
MLINFRHVFSFFVVMKKIPPKTSKVLTGPTDFFALRNNPIEDAAS